MPRKPMRDVYGGVVGMEEAVASVVILQRD
jgi:hypothetical protein